MQLATAADLATFRRFNRYFAKRTGVLSERYLGQDRPVGQSRLLYEIGPDAAAISELRRRLGLDAGQLSRMLAALERAGLVRLRPDPDDARRRVAELTEAGRRERAAQEDRSDDAAARLLAGLAPSQRAELLAALTTAERLLHVAGATFTVTDPDAPDARRCLAAYTAELRGRFPEGYDDADLVPSDQVSGEAGVFVVAHDDGLPAGCGAVRTLRPGVGELRHLWVAPAARGLGLGRRLLTELERLAAERGLVALRLSTHPVLDEAKALYRAMGYAEIPAYGDDPHGQLWFEKRL